MSKKGVDIIVFSGLGKIGSGSFILIYHRKSHKAIIIDCGIDVSYLIQDLETAKNPADDCWSHVFDWIKTTELRDGPIIFVGMFVTHIHLDHIGGIPYLPQMPIFCSAFTRKFLLLYMSDKLEFEQYLCFRNDIEAVSAEIRLDPFRIIPYPAPHSTPGNLAFGVVVENQRIFFSSDFKLQLDSDADRDTYLKSISSFHPDFLILDGTGAMRPGYTGLESDVEASLNEIIANHSGRIYITFFSTNLRRLLGIRRICKEHGITWTYLGASIKSILLASSDPDLVTIAHNGTMPDAKVVVVAGCQGNYKSASERLSRGEVVNGYCVENGDALALSASQIPPCASEQRQMIRGYRSLGATIYRDKCYPDKIKGCCHDKLIHVSGHGGAADLRDTINALKSQPIQKHRKIQWKSPKILAYHADPVSMAALKAIAISECAIPSDNVFCPVPADGEIVTFSF